MSKENSDFVCPEVNYEEVVFIAGGEIGPVRDCVTRTLKENRRQDIRLFFGANSKKDLNGAEKLRELSEFQNNFHMITSLNSPDPEWNGEVGLITDVIRDQLNPEKVEQCFIYGTEAMIEETERTLKRMGVSEEEIYHDSFPRDY